MMGRVGERLEAILPLRLRGSHGRTAEVEAVIDTGFTEYITLPRATVEFLALKYRESGEFVLADGRKGAFDLYECILEWHGFERCVLAAVAEGGTLIGMSLLYGSRVEIDVRVGGAVGVARLPEP